MSGNQATVDSGSGIDKISSDSRSESVKPPVSEYSEYATRVVENIILERYWISEDVESDAKDRIRSKHGRGPHCIKCGLPPACLICDEKWGEIDENRQYNCAGCGCEFSDKPRRSFR